MRPWFVEHGYTLYRIENDCDDPSSFGCTTPEYIYEGEVELPYSQFGGFDEFREVSPLAVYPDVRGIIDNGLHCSYLMSLWTSPAAGRVCTRQRA